MVNKFSKVFPNDLSGVPLDWEIEFRIDLVSNTRSNSIPSHGMDLAELRELKEKLRIF